jgi:hypothetical protein
MAKGSGMIHPNMATTLGFVTTDAAVEPGLLRACLKRAVDVSFNRISVDGDTSTNDMVAVLANGASGVRVEGARDVARFEQALTDVLTRLATMVVRDGEGATKLITVEVTGAATEADALQIPGRSPARPSSGPRSMGPTRAGDGSSRDRTRRCRDRSARVRIAASERELRPRVPFEFSEAAARALER